MGAINTAKNRLRAVTVVSAVFGFVTLGVTIFLYNYLSHIDEDTPAVDDGQDKIAVCLDALLGCHKKQTWMELNMLAILASIYELTSSFFVFRGSLGMRSWIVGNMILAVYFAGFGFFILPVFPNLMVVFLVNAVVVILCSFMGYSVKNMSSFEESSMSLL